MDRIWYRNTLKYQFICMLYVSVLEFAMLLLFGIPWQAQTQLHGKRKKSAWKTCKHINGITDTFTRYFLKIWLPSFFRKKYSLYILNETCLLYQEFKQVFILKISASLLRTGYLFFWLQAQNLWNFWNLVSFVSTLSLWMCEKFLLINTNFSFALF